MGRSAVQLGPDDTEVVVSVYGSVALANSKTHSASRALGCPSDLATARPGANFVTRCQTVTLGLEKGKQWCVSARRPPADVCKRIWCFFEDMGTDSRINADVACKAHLTEVEKSKLRKWERAIVAETTTPTAVAVGCSVQATTWCGLGAGTVTQR